MMDRWSGEGLDASAGGGFGEAVGIALRHYGRNAKLCLTVWLASTDPVDGLYLHPEHRRRARRPDSFGSQSV
jgi:hypothetical protein